ncbi:hypothetical protein B0A48_18634 [Cryoendolithus antarcticus]|uniref:NB-ARC domain-containing protein n=1 Tax=Cryoendolithus antarcticus TaxID=1507870 RepID=A0A1V8S8A7_9PEZI|nr:hypothetical protein B0A48_18634 [Cryoendolithus antarcticus]
MNRAEVAAKNDPSSRLTMAADILAIVVALLQLITLPNQYSDLDIRDGTNILGNVFGGLTINPKAATRPDYAGTYSHTSLRPLASYVVRQKLQQQVKERLHASRADGGTHSRLVVLVGLGGAGKSQLALNYIQTHRKEYDAVFWVDVRQRESLERDYIQIYRLLSGNEQSATSLRVDMDQVTTAVKTWFERREGRWLFVYDNADSLDDESDPYFVDLQRYLPDAPGIEVVITTRSQTATGMTELEAIEVGKLAPVEAVEMFMRCAKLSDAAGAGREETALIVAELDYLALAVTLAGTYVAATPRIRANLAEYLPEYRRRRKVLLGRKAKQQIHAYGESVLSTWETSCATIAKQCPVAVRLLSFFAFLDPADIFLEMFRHMADPSTVGSAYAEEDWERFLSPEGPLEEVFDEALKAFSTYSLIQWKEEQAGYSMHKLVHAWGFDRLEVEEQARYSRGNLAFLKSITQVGQLDPVKKSWITPHISSSVARLREWHWGSRSRSGAAVPGKYESAETMNRRALEGCEKVLGKEHPDTLASVSNLALVLQYQGKYEAAETMNRRALEGCEKVLGKDHPDTLTSMSNLALVLQYQGKYEAAETMNRRALEGCEKVLGKEHSDTLTSVYCLAYLLHQKADFAAAVPLYERACLGYVVKLGPSHPTTVQCVSHMSSLKSLMSSGKSSNE